MDKPWSAIPRLTTVYLAPTSYSHFLLLLSETHGAQSGRDRNGKNPAFDMQHFVYLGTCKEKEANKLWDLLCFWFDSQRNDAAIYNNNISGLFVERECARVLCTLFDSHAYAVPFFFPIAKQIIVKNWPAFSRGLNPKDTADSLLLLMPILNDSVAVAV